MSTTAVPQRVGSYKFVRTLGLGNFATVKLAVHQLTNQEVAIKIVNKAALRPEQLQKLYREVRILKKLDHPHIVKLYEVLESDDALYLVLEFAPGGELYDFLIVHGKMKEKEVRTKFLQIMSALLYCHSRRIIHRDLKAENLLLDFDLNIKVADFGFSNEYNPAGVLETFCGTPAYAAPEIFRGVRYTGPEVDVWSLGVILYVMATSCLPFDGGDLQEMKAVVCSGRFIIPDHVSPGSVRRNGAAAPGLRFSLPVADRNLLPRLLPRLWPRSVLRGSELQSLIRSMVVVDRSQRSHLTAFLDHPWLSEDGPVRDRLRALGVDDEALGDRASLIGGIADHALLPVDVELIQAMSRKFGLAPDEITESIRENEFNEITATYKLMLKERSLYVSHERHEQSFDVRQANTPTALRQDLASATTAKPPTRAHRPLTIAIPEAGSAIVAVQESAAMLAPTAPTNYTRTYTLAHGQHAVPSSIVTVANPARRRPTLAITNFVAAVPMATSPLLAPPLLHPSRTTAVRVGGRPPLSPSAQRPRSGTVGKDSARRTEVEQLPRSARGEPTANAIPESLAATTVARSPRRYRLNIPLQRLPVLSEGAPATPSSPQPVSDARRSGCAMTDDNHAAVTAGGADTTSGRPHWSNGLVGALMTGRRPTAGLSIPTPPMPTARPAMTDSPGADIATLETGKPRMLHIAFSAASTSCMPPTPSWHSPVSGANIDVCRLSKVYGVRFERLAGASEAYKAMCESILSLLRV